ncbi:MAG: DUF554 domain-containing protein [Spirochaetales bacterium]|nr:DUF554 domain-containing protein [Spirochaetales bacterium]
MIATIVNCITVIIGSIIGLLFHRKIKGSYKEAVFTAIGCFSLVIGMKLALGFEHVLIIVLSLVIGGILGYLLDIEGALLKFGTFLKNRFSKKEEDHSFAQGFLNASILFCVGAMAIIGALNAGIDKNYDLLLTKSVMDGFVAIFLTAAMGIGVMFSIISLLIYQGGLTLLAAQIAPFLNDTILTELSSVGGILIVMIGINMLDLKKLKTGNFIPALVLVLVLTILQPQLAPFFARFGF